MDTELITTAIKIAQSLAEPAYEQLAAERESSTSSIVDRLVGTDVLIRTVTMTLTGHIEAIDATLIELSSAAWIADTGRFAAALTTGTLSEVEPFPDVAFVNRGAIVDIAPWAHDLPRTNK